MAKCARGIIDVYPGERDTLKIKLRPERVPISFLGTAISEAEMKEILTRLEFVVSDDFEVTVPTFRPDVEREIDLIEEIARVHGYDNIPMTILQGRHPNSTARPEIGTAKPREKRTSSVAA